MAKKRAFVKMEREESRQWMPAGQGAHYMSNAIFTGVGMAGLTFPITRRMQTSTVIQSSASGMEVRSPNYSFPRWQWDLQFTYLSQLASVSDYQNFLGFLGARSGPYDSFLLYDENDCYVSNQIIGTGNGVTLAFQLQRSNGLQTQPVYDINGITATLAPAPAVNIYVAGCSKRATTRSQPPGCWRSPAAMRRRG